VTYVYRVLVTGSRDWTDEEFLWSVLDVAASGTRIRIVHGACPSGADLVAQAWCDLKGIEAERHPADWDRYHKAAGPIRNQEMVDLGADVCYAFFSGDGTGSKGTADCVERAEKAGIPVRKFYGDPDAAAR
jgi:hypothetical protein